MNTQIRNFLIGATALCLCLSARGETPGNDAAGLAALVSSSPPVSSATVTNQAPPKSEFETKIELAHQRRTERDYGSAAQILEAILTTNAPAEFQRRALFELALVTIDNGEAVKAQQILAQYLHVYPEDPSVPEILLRQGLLYRDMGINTLAISKFYAVMSSSLKLRLDNIEYYKKLVLQAQTEIADTYYLDGKFDSAAEFFARILKSEDTEMNRELLEYKLIRSLSYLTNHATTVGKAQIYLEQFPKSSNIPEIRFLLASALKNLGRNQDSMKQVLMLLQSQQENVRKDPDTWIYWQRRAGNEIANQLYKEGDYVDALEIYQNLADLDKSPGWQVPVWYQVGMIYEQLQQWQKATDTYARIIDRKKELNGTNSTPTMASLVDMAQWRADYIAWMEKAHASNLALGTSQPAPTNAPAAGIH